MTAPTKAPPTDTGRCGEPAGYARHQRAGEHPCEPCRLAKRVEGQRRLAERNHRRLADALAGARAGAKPLPPWAHPGAGRDIMHYFRSRNGSQCVECFGWRDDPRHL